MLDPRILIGLALAGVWASALLAVDDEIEREERDEKAPEDVAPDIAGQAGVRPLPPPQPGEIVQNPERSERARAA